MKYLCLLLMIILAFPVMTHADDDDAPDVSYGAPSVLVTSMPVEKGNLPDSVTGYGTVEPLPNGSTKISELRAGQIVKLDVSLGQKVQQDSPLLDFTSDPAAMLAYNQAVAALAAARNEQSRTRQMLEQHLATQLQIAQADKAVADARAALAAQKSQGGGKQSETITAPYDGVITGITVSTGDRVQANAPLLQLAHNGGLGVALGLPLDQCASVHTGDVVHLQSLDAGGTEVDGRVAVVASMLDPKTRLVKIVVALPQKKSAAVLQGEQFRATIERGEFSGIIVPRDAVLKDKKGPYIFQIDGNKAARVDVRIVGESGNQYVIAGPIDAQKKIVTSGNYELKDGMAIREGGNP
ncbi:MAG TPA: efflux RND transporter periplasmic adaptor subunit [Alphaproteobacteria bacterium]|nr:efflux RND transporter periplasmic adaptor subunit [Alphaproteobacteria bacterium]